jgi:hypothetical protein
MSDQIFCIRNYINVPGKAGKSFSEFGLPVVIILQQKNIANKLH